LPIQPLRFISKLAGALFEAGQLIDATTLSEIGGGNLHAFHGPHEPRRAAPHVVEPLPHLLVVRTTIREVAEYSRESQVVSAQRLNPIGNLSDQRFAIGAASNSRTLQAARTPTPEMGLAHAARAMLGQFVHGVMQFLTVIEDVPPAAKQVMARRARLALGFAGRIDDALHASEEGQE
jgi:hypothetical protein